MSAKYQVFVSSTYTDLKDERDLVIKATLEMGHIPVGMEMFSAADEEQWNIIKKQIDQSDYYVVVVAHRYGSVTREGTSYTEMEYDYALSKGIPTLGFVLADGVQWDRTRCDTDKKLVARLDVFKSKVKAKPVSFWSNKEDLYGKCSIALMKAFNAYPRDGWVRASTRDDAATREAIRLSAENADLRQRLEAFEAHSAKQKSLDGIIETLRANIIAGAYYKKDGTGWERPEKQVSMLRAFEILSPELQVESALHDLSRYLVFMAWSVSYGDQRVDWPYPRNQLRMLMADLAALGCIAPSAKKRSSSDKNEYWSLTDFGRELLSYLRRRRLERLEESEAPPERTVDSHPGEMLSEDVAEKVLSKQPNAKRADSKKPVRKRPSKPA